MAKYSKAAEKAIGEKMHKMAGEDKPQAQKIAIAISEAESKGFKVPEKLAKKHAKQSKKA